MRTDTAAIPVIEVEPVCTYCTIRLKAIPDDPVELPHGTFHPSCVQPFIWRRPARQPMCRVPACGCDGRWHA